MADPFTRLTAIAAPLLRDNVDTDAIIPSREMKSVGKDGLAEGLFAGWRYRAIGSRDPAPDFILNDPAYAGVRFLLSGANFGCGSSREHAAWALAEYGFRAVVATSFNPIFRGNCVRNGIVPVELAEADIATLAAWVEQAPAEHPLTIDLEAQQVSVGPASFAFSIDAESREMLLHGLDPIRLTLRNADRIAALRATDAQARPWAYL